MRVVEYSISGSSLDWKLQRPEPQQETCPPEEELTWLKTRICMEGAQSTQTVNYCPVLPQGGGWVRTQVE